MRYAGHVAAGLQECQEDEQNEHLRDEAEDGADTGDDAVKDQAASASRRSRLRQTALDQSRDTGNPDAVVGRIRRVAAVGSSITRRPPARQRRWCPRRRRRGSPHPAGCKLIVQGLPVLDRDGRAAAAASASNSSLSLSMASATVFGLGFDTQNASTIWSRRYIRRWRRYKRRSRCPTGASRRRTRRRSPSRSPSAPTVVTDT